MLALRRLTNLRQFSIKNLDYYAKVDLLSPTNHLVPRHIGPSSSERIKMLQEIGVNSLEELIKKTLPENLPRNNLPSWPLKTEEQIIQELESMSKENILRTNFLGGGYYGSHTPLVILRNVMQNPAWYTSYTPYQAEISQGRLESLLIYQTMVSDLTGLKVANASLLDEATAGAEAMTMAYLINNKQKSVFIVSEKVFPQTIAVIKTRAEPLGIQVVVTDIGKYDFSNDEYFGVLVQSPDRFGEIRDFSHLSDTIHSKNASLIVGSDLLALCLIKSPGEMGADISYGNSQRFGVPMGYGGPHAAFFSSKEEHIRKIPGRIIGVSKDRNGSVAYRMTMQTREQHIRREKATSNICTAQALLANMAGLYSVYHGPEGLTHIAQRVHNLARLTSKNLTTMGYKTGSGEFFDTVHIQDVDSSALIQLANSKNINLRKQDSTSVTASFDETHTLEDLTNLLNVFAEYKSSNIKLDLDSRFEFFNGTKRGTEILKHEIYNKIHSETQMLRYLYRLQRKDISLANSMIPLGSCTMKLNATCEMIPVTFPGFGKIHPHVPLDQAKGYTTLIEGLRTKLKAITGFDEISFQPNSGAQGEYAGLISIRNYFKHHSQGHRKVCLIPTSAHGTNPATASMCGMTVVPVSCDKQGNISTEDLKQKAEKYKNDLAALMVTYPSTHGVFESGICEVIEAVHYYGGQVYMDGANMNAQVGLTSPGHIGADVCHLNLHKTFAIPHGGGGPGMGPIGVKSHLVPFLPRDVVLNLGGSGGQISSTHFASASILPISWAYIEGLGSVGLTESSKHAILNANYIRKRLEKYFNIVYVGHQGQVAHELLIDLRSFKQSAEVTEEDVAKRLMDFGFHAPTMSFPIPGTLMIEPTESEDKGELDRLCDSLIKIREEIHEIESGAADRKVNVLKLAPHSLEDIAVLNWDRPYNREKAAFPLPFVKTRGKYWPTISRIDNAWGDKHPNTVLPDLDFHL